VLKGARLGEGVVPAPEPSAPPPAPVPAPAAMPVAAVSAPGPASGELPSNLPEYLNQVERDIIQRALQQTQFNRTQAATLLGISLRQLRYQMQKLGIHAPED
jgi:two-component system response regulator PilR (NtrC family)